MKNNYFIFLGLLMFMSCHTYQTYYGVTDDIQTYDKNTKRLNLSDVKKENIKLDRLDGLRMLNLSHLDIDRIEEILQSIKNTNALEILILEGNDLKQIPKSVLRFSNLKQLSLENNPNINWEQAFKDIQQLPLVFLNLKNNKIQKLPLTISKLKTLKDLNLGYNHLTDEKSYTYLSALPNLYNLWLDHNEFEELPLSIGKLNQISYLYIDHNRLKTLPVALAAMDKLWVLHAGHNQIKVFPIIFTETKRLVLVHLNNNQIERFPNHYENSKFSIKGLVLNNNPVAKTHQEWIKKHFKNFFLLSID